LEQRSFFSRELESLSHRSTKGRLAYPHTRPLAELHGKLGQRHVGLGFEHLSQHQQTGVVDLRIPPPGGGLGPDLASLPQLSHEAIDGRSADLETVGHLLPGNAAALDGLDDPFA